MQEARLSKMQTCIPPDCHAFCWASFESITLTMTQSFALKFADVETQLVKC